MLFYSNNIFLRQDFTIAVEMQKYKSAYILKTQNILVVKTLKKYEIAQPKRTSIQFWVPLTFLIVILGQACGPLPNYLIIYHFSYRSMGEKGKKGESESGREGENVRHLIVSHLGHKFIN